MNGSLSFNGGGTLHYGLANVTTAGGGVNDLIAVSGQLTIAGPTALNVSLINGTTAPGGNYTIFTYGSFSGSIANLTAPSGYTVVNTGSSIQLQITHIPESLTWQGDGSANVWDTGTTPNWTNSAGKSVDFFTGDSATFSSTGSDNPYININAGVSPGSVTVSSSGYDFAGSGAITTGNLSLTSGTLILENNNTYNGPTVIGSGAVLQVGGPTEGGASGSLGAGPVTNNGALVFDLTVSSTQGTNIYGTGNITNISTAGTVTLSGNIIGGGNVNMAAPGAAMVLSGSNSYSGQTRMAVSLGPMSSC